MFGSGVVLDAVAGDVGSGTSVRDRNPLLRVVEVEDPSASVEGSRFAITGDADALIGC
jgi:hypothetical protein